MGNMRLRARLKSRRRRKKTLIKPLFSGKFETPHVVFYSDELFLNKTLREKNTSIDESAFALLRRQVRPRLCGFRPLALTCKEHKEKSVG